MTHFTIPVVPPEIEHSLIWSRVPFFPPDLPSPTESKLSARLLQDGLWGFTGLSSPPPSPSLLPQALPALEPWGITEDKLIRSPRGTDEEERQIKEYGKEIEIFIKRNWNEREWETAWFLNPPVSAYILTLAIESVVDIASRGFKVYRVSRTCMYLRVASLLKRSRMPLPQVMHEPSEILNSAISQQHVLHLPQTRTL